LRQFPRRGDDKDRLKTDSGARPAMTTKVGTKAEQAGDSVSLQMLARFGLIAYAGVHLLIGWLALRLAWGASASKSADTSGALKTLAAQPFGQVLLWLTAAGLLALALWQGSAAIWGYRDSDPAQRVRKRCASGAKAATYLALGVSAASVSLGSGSSSSQSQEHTTSGVLAWPGGQVIVVVAGLVIIGVGVASVVKGVTQSFSEEIESSSLPPAARQAVARLGQVGYITKGVALGVVGGLLGYAALTFEPSKSRGLDGAMQTILAQPFGRLLLTAVGLGFVAFGLFATLQARYRPM
jgi:Domain of Unknown Function (DUF1206)